LADRKVTCILIHHIHQSRHSAISGYSLTLNWRWKETVLTRFRRSKLHRMSWKPLICSNNRN
jgi:hypothetical protein